MSSTSSSASSTSSSRSTSSISSMSSSSRSTSSSSSLWDGTVFEPYGSFVAHPSLTIDVLNSDQLAEVTKSLFEGELPPVFRAVSPLRLRGDFRNRDAVWGFRETCPHRDSKQMSNAVVLTGEKVIIYIAPQGHGLGYLGLAGDGMAFAMTSLHITLFDILRGVEKTVVFSNFGAAANDPSRFILWQPAEKDAENEQMYTDKGFNGLYSIRVREVNTYYSKADWSQELQFPDDTTPPVNESWTQFAAYWWKRSLVESEVNPAHNPFFLSNVEFRNGVALDGNTIQQDFDDRTKFPNFLRVAGAQTFDLTDEQKEIVMRDSTMGLLLAQGPILTGDSGVVPTIGISITDGAGDPRIERSTVVRIVDEASPQPNRLYGLNGVPAITNLHQPVADMASNHNATTFSFRDPAKMIESTVAGVGSNIVFSPNGVEIKWAGTVSNVVDLQTALVLGQQPGVEETPGFIRDEIFASSTSSLNFTSSLSTSSPFMPVMEVVQISGPVVPLEVLGLYEHNGEYDNWPAYSNEEATLWIWRDSGEGWRINTRPGNYEANAFWTLVPSATPIGGIFSSLGWYRGTVTVNGL